MELGGEKALWLLQIFITLLAAVATPVFRTLAEWAGCGEPVTLRRTTKREMLKARRTLKFRLKASSHKHRTANRWLWLKSRMAVEKTPAPYRYRYWATAIPARAVLLLVMTLMVMATSTVAVQVNPMDRGTLAWNMYATVSISTASPDITSTISMAATHPACTPTFFGAHQAAPPESSA